MDVHFFKSSNAGARTLEIILPILVRELFLVACVKSIAFDAPLCIVCGAYGFGVTVDAY